MQRPTTARLAGRQDEQTVELGRPAGLVAPQLGHLAERVDLVEGHSRQSVAFRGRRLRPDLLGKASVLDWSHPLEALCAAEDVLVVGRGLGVAIAHEAALKLKETSSLHAEAFSTAELRHGPMAILRPGLPVLVFSQDDETRAGVQELVVDLRASATWLASE